MDTQAEGKPTYVVNRPGRSPRNLTIALTAKWPAYPERLRWIEEHGFALEYAADPGALERLAGQVEPYVRAGMPVRYHGFLPGYELGHADPALAERGLDKHLAALDAMHGHGEQVITFHVGLNPDDPLDARRVVENLTRVVEHGCSLGITVCLENLRRGPTSDPYRVMGWAEASGAMTTFDIGHAVSSETVRSGKLTALQFLEIMSSRLREVHMYERETDRHHPPTDMSIVGPIVDLLLDTECGWWTIELDDYAEALATRALLVDYLRAQ